VYNSACSTGKHSGRRCILTRFHAAKTCPANQVSLQNLFVVNQVMSDSGLEHVRTSTLYDATVSRRGSWCLGRNDSLPASSPADTSIIGLVECGKGGGGGSTGALVSSCSLPHSTLSRQPATQ
jgi:hypothetical protein